MSTELATAWIRLVPSTEGIQGSLVDDLTGAGRAAGDAGGEEAGSRFNSSFTRMLGGAALTAGVVAGFKGLYNVGSTWEDVTNSIEVGTGAQGDALQGLVDDTKAVASAVPVDIEDVGEAITSLNTYTDASGDSLQDLTASVMDASRMLGEDGTANAEAFGQSMQQWQIPAEDGPAIMDSLFKATQDYGVGLDDTISNLGTYGSVLNNAGFSMEESAALFGNLEGAGLSVSRIMPGLNSAFREWAGEGKNVQEELFGTVDAISEAETSSEALTIATEAFGAEGAQRLTTAIRSGNFEIQDLGEALEGADGLISETADSTMTFADHWELVKNQGSAALEPLATALMEGIGDGLEFVMPLLEGLTETLEEHSWILPTVAGVIGGVLTAAVIGWTAAVLANTVALLANPMTWIFLAVVAAVAALTAAIIWLYNNWDQLLEWLSGAWEAGIELVMAGLEWFGELWETIWTGVSEFFSSIWESVTTFLSEAWDSASELVNAGLEAFGDFWRSIWEGISDFFSGIWESVTSFFTSTFEAAQSAAQTILNGFQAAWETVWGAIRSFFQALFAPLMAVFTGDLDGAVDTARAILDGFQDFWSGVWEGIQSFVTDIGSDILSFLSETWDSLYDSAVDSLDSLLDWVSDIPSRIMDIFSDAGSWLIDAGSDIIGGLLDGLTGAFGSVRDSLTGFTSDLVSWKGPPERDKVLLYDAGQLVIGGFEDGLEDEYGSVQDSLQRFTADIPGAASARPGSVEAGAGASQQGGSTMTGPLVEVKEMRVDSDGRVKQVAQELWDRANRANRSRGSVNLGGVTA